MLRKKRCVAMLLAGGQGSRLGILTRHVAKPAVPFGGKYRIIDFPLSNCSNSGKVNDAAYICTKKGMVSPGHHCWRFKYDPLKRVPVKKDPTDFSKYDDVDFSL